MSCKQNAKDLGNNSEENLLQEKWKTFKGYWEGERIKKKISYGRIPGSLIILFLHIVNMINTILFELQCFTWKKNILMADLKRQKREGIKTNYSTEG